MYSSLECIVCQRTTDVLELMNVVLYCISVWCRRPVPLRIVRDGKKCKFSFLVRAIVKSFLGLILNFDFSHNSISERCHLNVME